MNRAAEAMGDIVHRFISRVPDMDEGLAIDWVLDAAQDYVDGKLPWYEAAKIGAVTRIDWRTGRDIESAAYTRFLAVVFAKPSDPRRAAVLALCTEIVAQSGAVLTTHGLFNRDELHERNVTVRSEAA
jgi:hypothetical protein